MKSVAAIRHVVFEGLDGLRPTLERQGYTVTYHDAPAGLDTAQILAADLVVILGGPMGVYEADQYPFLQQEIDIARRRLQNDQPLLGICLGSQIMAAALGAQVYPGAAGVELGWSALTLTEAGKTHPLAALAADGTEVLHWHGDTFDLPDGAVRLASSGQYANQAFSYGRNGLALQCHTEVTGMGLDGWCREYAAYLEAAHVDIQAFRDKGQRQCTQLAPSTERFITRWLETVESA